MNGYYKVLAKLIEIVKNGKLIPPFRSLSVSISHVLKKLD